MSTPFAASIPVANPPSAAAMAKTTVNDSDPAQVKKVAAQFEGLMVHELLKAMRSTVDELRDDEEEFGTEMSTELSDQALADHVAGRLGIGDVLAKQLGAREQASAPSLGIGQERSASPRRYHGAIPGDEGGAKQSQLMRLSGASRSREGILGLNASVSREMPVQGEISSAYGHRLHPISGEHSFHEGLDIAAPMGTEIRAADAGKVIFAGQRGGYGNVVEVEHDDQTRTIYAHASRLHVRTGDRVEAGEAIADVGSTGQSTGPHLHFEVRRNDRAIDPLRYLRGHGNTAGLHVDSAE